MWIFGSVLTVMIVSDQLESWKRNPTISSRKWVDLSEVPFPALTFCHQGNTRMEVAERLLQAADESSPKVRVFKSWLLKNTVEYFMQYYTYYYEVLNSIYEKYQKCNCSSSSMKSDGGNSKLIKIHFNLKNFF